MKPGLLFMAKMETGTVILLVGGFIALIVVLAIIGKRATDKSIAQGKMLKRSSDFMEYAEIFTTRPLPFQELANQVKQIQVERLKIEMKFSQYGASFVCSPGFISGWTASLNELEVPDGRTDISRFRFEFTHWTEKNGSAECSTLMNRFLTEIEKAILTCDWNATVHSRPLKLQSKRSFF